MTTNSRTITLDRADDEPDSTGSTVDLDGLGSSPGPAAEAGLNRFLRKFHVSADGGRGSGDNLGALGKTHGGQAGAGARWMLVAQLTCKPPF